MPEEVLNQRSESTEGPSPASSTEEWISLREAARMLNLASTRQVRRRLKVENWRSRMVKVSGIVKREVYFDDVASSKRNVIDEVIDDDRYQLRTSSSDVIDKSHSSHRTDVIAMSHVVKDFLGAVNSIKDKFDGMIESQHKIAETQDRMAEAQDKALNIAEKRFEIGKRRFRHERLRSVVLLILFVVVAGLVVAGIYHGYTCMAKYYEEELNLREKEIGVLDGVYNNLLEKHERELARKDMLIEERETEIEELRKEIETQKEILIEVGEGLIKK